MVISHRGHVDYKSEGLATLYAIRGINKDDTRRNELLNHHFVRPEALQFNRRAALVWLTAHPNRGRVPCTCLTASTNDPPHSPSLFPFFGCCIGQSSGCIPVYPKRVCVPSCGPEQRPSLIRVRSTYARLPWLPPTCRPIPLLGSSCSLPLRCPLL